MRYPLVGETGQGHFDGTNFKRSKLLENAQIPTTLAPVLFRGARREAPSQEAVLGSIGKCISATFGVWVFNL